MLACGRRRGKKNACLIPSVGDNDRRRGRCVERDKNDEDDDVVEPRVKPREEDVLCRRGGKLNKGTVDYRKMVNKQMFLYASIESSGHSGEKGNISRKILADIRGKGGRFLKYNSGTWFVLDDKTATERISQALREGQPKLQKKMLHLPIWPTQMTSRSPCLGFRFLTKMMTWTFQS